MIIISDFEIKTEEALISWFHTKQFEFECFKGEKNEYIQDIFRQIAIHMPAKEINKGIYYRARVIKQSDGEETGIIRKNNIPVTGYNAQYSGIAPPEKITTNGRVNRIGEPVLYLAEDIETSCKELKASEDAYISAAECVINNTIKIIDFTVTVSEGL